MRTLMTIAWLFVGLAGTIYHFGPGQEQLEVDRLNEVLAKARFAVEHENYRTAMMKFDEVLADLPPEKADVAQRVLLEKTKVQMMAQELPEARQSLETMLSELTAQPDADPALVDDVRATLANAQYYNTWLMRLEGLAEEDWMPEIEAARQNFTLLLKKAEQGNDSAAAKRSAEDLESSIRLARMDLSELQALALPSQCNGCCSCNKKSKKKGKKKKKESKGGGLGEIPEGSGS